MDQDFYACTTLPQGATVLQIAEGHRNRTGASATWGWVK